MSYGRIYEEIATQSHGYVLAGYHHVRRFELTLEFLREILRKGTGSTATLLDIGCGDGFFDELINKYFGSSILIVGVDISKTRVKRAQCRVPNGSYILADIYHLPFNKAFDISIVSQVIEHLRQPQAALKEVNRILMDKAYLILDTPSKSNIVDMLLRLIHIEPTWGLQIEKTHVAFYDEKSMQTLLNSAGFNITEIRGVSFIRYDLLSVLSITWDRRKWGLPRLLDSIAQGFSALKSKGAIQVFYATCTSIKSESIKTARTQTESKNH